MVSQETYIFKSTIFDNVRLMIDEGERATEEHIQEIIEILNKKPKKPIIRLINSFLKKTKTANFRINFENKFRISELYIDKTNTQHE